MVDGIKFTTNPEAERRGKPVLNEILILGNGFDLNLGLKTGFGDYMKWYATIQCHISESDFENSLKSNASDDLRAYILSKLDNFWLKLVYGLSWDYCKDRRSDDLRSMTWGNIEQIISAVLLSSTHDFKKYVYAGSDVESKSHSGYSNDDSYWNSLNRDYWFLVSSDKRDDWTQYVHIPKTAMNNKLQFFNKELTDFEYSFYDYLQTLSYFDNISSIYGDNEGGKSKWVSDWAKKDSKINKNNNVVFNLSQLLHDSVDFSKYQAVHITIITYNARYLRNVFLNIPRELTSWTYDSLHFLNIHGPILGFFDYFNFPDNTKFGQIKKKFENKLNINLKPRLVFGVSESFEYLFNANNQLSTEKKNKYEMFYKSNRLEQDIYQIESFERYLRENLLKEDLENWNADTVLFNNDLLTESDFLENQTTIVRELDNKNVNLDTIVKSYGHSMSQIDSKYFANIINQVSLRDSGNSHMGEVFFEFFQYYNPKFNNHRADMQKSLLNMYYFCPDLPMIETSKFYLKPIDLEVW